MVKGEKRLDVQGLRALAILFVLGFHGHMGVGSGFVGVDVFFAISGFVITTTLVAQLDSTETPRLGAFYARRVKRLLPALGAMLTVVALVGVLLAPVRAVHLVPLTALAASVFGANVYAASLPQGYFSVNSNLDPLLHTWTLGVEEQFYLVFPLILLFAWRLGRRYSARAVCTVVVAVLTVGSFLLASAWSASDSNGAFYASPARAWEFGAGVLTALLAPFWSRVPTLVCSALAATALPIVVASAFAAPEAGSLAERLAPPVLATCALMAAGTRLNVVSFVLSRRPLTAIGDLSYSLYLWHWPLIVFGQALDPSARWIPPTAGILSFAPALFSFRYIENPIRRLPLTGRPVLRLAGICVAVPAAAATAMLHVSFVAPATYSPAAHEDLVMNCDNLAPLGDPSREHCNFRVPNSRGTVVLIGDSNAGQFTEPVLAAAHALHLDVDIVTYSSCAFVPLQLQESGCVRRNALSMKAMARVRPKLVVIAGRSDVMVNDRRVAIAGLGRTPTNSSSLKPRIYERALREELTGLDRLGIRSLVVHPVPRLHQDEQACAVVMLALGHCSGLLPRAQVDDELRPAVTAESRAARGIPLASVMSVESAICGTKRCAATRNGVPMYRDRDHLSVPGSRTLSGRFEAAIRQRLDRA
ncbi:MAG: acyltransferase family protein [Gaiellaceae bacterium]